MLACFGYLTLLRSSSFPEWHQDELKTMADIDFEFASKRQAHTYAQILSTYLTLPIPRSEILTAPRLIYDWDEDMIRKTLSRLTIDRCRVLLMASDFEGISQDFGDWEKEPWYQTEYQVKDIGRAFVEKVSSNLYLNPLRYYYLNKQ